MTVDEAKEVSQIEDVRFLESFDGVFDMMMTREDVKSLYFDCYRHQQEDLPDYNAVKAKEYAALYPGHPIRNLFPYVAQMRMQKDADEVAQLKTAIGITDNALQYVMKHLEPGMAEYQAQADLNIRSCIRARMELRSRRLPEAVQTVQCCTTKPTGISARTARCC